VQAIETKYVGPTNHHGSRIIVRAQAGRVIVAWDDALSVDENHARAILFFAARQQWCGTWHMGGKADGTGNVAVCVTPRSPAGRIVVTDGYIRLTDREAKS